MSTGSADSIPRTMPCEDDHLAHLEEVVTQHRNKMVYYSNHEESDHLTSIDQALIRASPGSIIAGCDWRYHLSTMADEGTFESRGRALLITVDDLLYKEAATLLPGVAGDIFTCSLHGMSLASLAPTTAYPNIVSYRNSGPWRPQLWPDNLLWLLEIARSIIPMLPSYRNLTERQLRLVKINSPCLKHLIEGETMISIILKGLLHRDRLDADQRHHQRNIPASKAAISLLQKVDTLSNPLGRLCTLCFSPIPRNDQDVVSLPCDKRHIFDKKCIEPILRRDSRCPICERSVE